MAVELGFMGRVECQPKTPAMLLPEAFVVDLPFAWNLLVPVIYPLALYHLQLHFQNDALKLDLMAGDLAVRRIAHHHGKNKSLPKTKLGLHIS